MLQDNKSTHRVVSKFVGFVTSGHRFVCREPKNAEVGEPNTGVKRNVVPSFDWRSTSRSICWRNHSLMNHTQVFEGCSLLPGVIKMSQALRKVKIT